MFVNVMMTLFCLFTLIPVLSCDEKHASLSTVNDNERCCLEGCVLPSCYTQARQDMHLKRQGVTWPVPHHLALLVYEHPDDM